MATAPIVSPHRISDFPRSADSQPPQVPATDRDERAAQTRDLLVKAASEDDQSARELQAEAVRLNVDVAESIVMRYRNRGVPTEDLVQVACLGLVKAAHGYDPSKSENFLGYAVPTILGEVKRFFRDNAWMVRPPRRIQELQAEISAASARLMHSEGRTPSPQELAAELHVSVDDIREALAADGCFSPGSLDRPSSEDDTTTLSDVLGDEDAGFSRAEAIVALRPLCRGLCQRDRRIVYLRFFHDWTQARIAEEFGVTQMQVSRLLTRILKRLRSELGPVIAANDAGPAEAERRHPRSIAQMHRQARRREAPDRLAS